MLTTVEPYYGVERLLNKNSATDVQILRIGQEADICSFRTEGPRVHHLLGWLSQ